MAPVAAAVGFVVNAIGGAGAASAIAGVALTGAQLYQQRKAAKATGRAAELQQRQQALQAQTSRRAAIRRAAAQRAQARASAEGLGATGSSAIAGGLGSQQSQLDSSIGTQSQMSGLSQEIGVLQTRSADAQGRASLFGVGAGLAFSAPKLAASFQTQETTTAQVPVLN